MSDEKEPKYQSKEFRKLRNEWYKKLDDSGFDDIERTGRLRSTYYDETGAILKTPDSVIRAKYTLESFQYYQNLRNFSHAVRITSTSSLNDSKKPKKHLLSSVDRIILRKIGNGATIKETSDYLRLRCKPPKKKLGRKGKPYSTYYVHSRLETLINLMNTCTYDTFTSHKADKSLESLENSDLIKKAVDISDSICNNIDRESDGALITKEDDVMTQTKKPQKAKASSQAKQGGVSKKGLPR